MSTSDKSGLELRPYQEAEVAALRASYAAGNKAPLYMLPTAGGKTVVFSYVISGVNRKRRRTLVAVHRRELIRQAGAKLTWAGVAFGVIAAGFEPCPDQMVQLGSLQTLARRLSSLPTFDFIIFDEARHCRAETWRTLIDAQPQARLLGVTATPARSDGNGLGRIAGGPFDDLVIGASTAELISAGYLSPVQCFVPAQKLDLHGVPTRGGDYVASDLAATIDRPTITGDSVEQYKLHADHQPAIAFCATVAHAEHVARAFRDAGCRAARVHGATPIVERDACISGLADGRIEVLISCDLISEGLDVPAVGCVILLRPTKSLVLHRQQIGRGMRIAPGSALIVNDHVRNVIVHGLPDSEINWTLAGVEKNSGEAPVWRCAECGASNPNTKRVCQSCGAVRPVGTGRPRIISTAAGELAHITAERFSAIRRMTYRQVLGTKLTESELREYARAYHPWWVRHRLREQARGGGA
jgi:superfamily II DNA or RNA helicase